jgi:hypothetical protein
MFKNLLKEDTMAKGKKQRLVERRLLTYSAAAAGLLALAPSADAAVRYSGAKNLVVNSGNPSVKIDLNFDGVNDLSFTFSDYYGAGIYLYWLSNAGAYSFYFINEPYNGDPVRLPCNYLVKYTANAPNYWYHDTFDGYETLAGGFATAGNFNGAKGSIGVAFNTPSGWKYGWIRFDGTSAPTSGIIEDWAYEDSGFPIRTCDTVGIAPEQIPATDHLGLLILITLLAGASLKMLKKEKA